MLRCLNALTHPPSILWPLNRWCIHISYTTIKYYKYIYIYIYTHDTHTHSYVPHIYIYIYLYVSYMSILYIYIHTYITIIFHISHQLITTTRLFHVPTFSKRKLGPGHRSSCSNRRRSTGPAEPGESKGRPVAAQGQSKSGAGRGRWRMAEMLA